MSDTEQRQQRRARIRNIAGVAFLLIAFGVSAAYVFYQSFMVGETNLAGGRKTIRFAHWQLEGRTVEALNWAADEYMKLHPDVYVQQIPIPERGYRQWVRTQLIGRTAPDLIENSFDANVMIRYFSPITDVVEKPNPYNKGTELEDKPWRETYIDGMKGGWIASLQEYYTMPLSIFTIRIYANRDLLEKASGGPVRKPQTLGELFALCEKVKAYARRTGERVVPIAGSDYTANIFRSRYWGMATWGLLDVLDTNLDGGVSNSERYEAVMSGAVDLRTDPHVKAGYQVLFELSRYFNPGFMSAKRDQSVFLFAQGNAAMIATGTWDAGSLYRQVEGDFEIIVFDFPAAAPENPKYGKYIKYRLTEAGVKAGFPFALSRQSKNRELAIDFMQFLSSRKKMLVDGEWVGMNEELNRRFRWFPSVVGAEPDEILKPFAPKVDGIYPIFNPRFGPATQLHIDTGYKSYVGEDEPGQVEYGQFLSSFHGRRIASWWDNWGRVALFAILVVVALLVGKFFVLAHLSRSRGRWIRLGLTGAVVVLVVLPGAWLIDPFGLFASGADEPRDVIKDFKAEYGALADAFLATYAHRPDDYTYEQFIEDWRDEHWRKFISKHAANIEKDAPADMQKIIRGGYISITQSERLVASARIRAIRAGLTADPEGDVKRNLKALIFGQAKRTVELADLKRRVAAADKRRASAKGSDR